MDSIVTVDLRTKAIDINPQEVSKIKHAHVLLYLVYVLNALQPDL